MFWWRIIIKCVSRGIGVTVFLSIIAFIIGNEIATQILLPPTAVLIHALAPPIPFGQDYQGNVIYEGNPLNGFAIIIGFFACIPFYSLISFLVLLLIGRIKTKSPG